MRHLTLSRWIAVWMLAIALAPRTASAQGADTLSISGTFGMDQLQGAVGADLAAVFANGDSHAWMITLYDVTYSYDSYFYDWYDEWGYYGSDAACITSVYATSFDIEFLGPDADVLNEVVSQQLMTGSLFDNYMYAFLELQNGDYFDSADWESSGPYSHWNIGLMPADATAGVLFFASDWPYTRFSVDENGYPLVKPQRLTSDQTVIADYRPGNSGLLLSFGDVVDIGSAGPPPPTLNIQDGSVLEGNKGTSRLVLSVTLSWNSNGVVTVDYQTANGTALATSDYSSTRGTLTFLPGQTSRTIAISIKTDRKREPNETFSVNLSNAVGATIDDAVGTGTILNDD